MGSEAVHFCKQLRWSRPEDKDEIQSIFLPGGIAEGKWFYDEDWFRYWADGSVEIHELCADPKCNFHHQQ